MADEPSEAGQGGFLPPAPGGREPDLQGTPSPPPTSDQGWQPPDQGGRDSQQPPPPQDWQSQPGQGWQQQQPGWQQQPGQGWQQPQPWGYQQAQAPDNGAAVAGFVLSISAGALLVLSIGMSSLISVICGGLGIFYSRRGRSLVDRGETPKHRGLAQAGFIVGIVSVVLAVLATALWTVFLIAYATDDEFRREIDGQNSLNGMQSAIRFGAVAVRAALSLLT